jgi:ubiquinone/menaquinone biosynthesis C-methylase UbiE
LNSPQRGNKSPPLNKGGVGGILKGPLTRQINNMSDSTTPHKLPGQGKSSYDLINPKVLWKELDLSSGLTFLDLGCGEGNYSLAAAAIIAPTGIVYAVDLWKEGIAALKERAVQEGRDNLKAMVAPAGEIPLADHSIDVGFMATVLHDLVEAGTAIAALAEMTRLVKPGGLFGIVEFEKIDGPPGPPRHIRLAPEEVEELVTPYGFRRQKLKKLGPYNYLITFVKL